MILEKAIERRDDDEDDGRPVGMIMIKRKDIVNAHREKVARDLHDDEGVVL
jgi:hypothetical protein